MMPEKMATLVMAGAQVYTSVAIFSGIIILLRGMLMTFPDFYQMVRIHAAGLITVCGV